MTFIEDLELTEAILGDVVAFAAGQPVSVNKVIGASTLAVSAVVLPNGPSGGFEPINGSVLSILAVVLLDVTSFVSGLPIQIAVKEKNTWYGFTLTYGPTVPVATASVAAKPGE